MGLFDALRGNASTTSSASVQKELAPLLLEGEQVARAFKFIRDMIVFTDRRLIFVNKKGMTGSKGEWQTIPYSKITSFSAETAGFFDTDAELRIWVGSSPDPIKIEVSKSVPIRELYQLMSHCILR